MEIVYRSIEVNEANRFAGKLVEAGLHPVTEQQDRTGPKGGRYFEWVIWLPAEEMVRAKPILLEWRKINDAKIKSDLQEIHRQVDMAVILGLLILAVSWLVAPKVFVEKWGEFVVFAFLFGGITAIAWNELRRRKR
jgi:hypothetical protein